MTSAIAILFIVRGVLIKHEKMHFLIAGYHTMVIAPLLGISYLLIRFKGGNFNMK